jgi:hypothetical protein
MVEAEGFYETLINIYQITRHHISENRNVQHY